LGLLRLHRRRHGRGFALDGLDVSDHFLLFPRQQVVELLASPIPFRLPGGLLGRGKVGFLAHHARGRLLGPGARHGLGPPVDNQQEQDQRSHGAKEDRQEGKC